jgi:hypothetical protein
MNLNRTKQHSDCINPVIGTLLILTFIVLTMYIESL